MEGERENGRMASLDDLAKAPVKVGWTILSRLHRPPVIKLPLTGFPAPMQGSPLRRTMFGNRGPPVPGHECLEAAERESG
jgi:hypothetical protein